MKLPIRTVGGAWASFDQAVLEPINASPLQRLEMRKAFYGGAFVMQQILLGLGETTDSDDVIESKMKALQDECLKFITDLPSNEYQEIVWKPLRNVPL